MLQQTHQTLDTGLQSFAESSPDYIMAPVGLGSLQEQAENLAEYGRHGDIYVVHAAEGETVVPMEVLDANPKIRELLFDQMRGMGIDPQRYVVGNELNSLNPDTGMPEFFFKSIFKGIKKVVKKVVKIVKKAAPIVIPIAAAAFGIPFLGIPAGSFAASFIGSGIGSLVGGNNLKTAFRDAVIGGGLASLGAGLKGALSPTGTFMGGLEGSFTGMTPVYSPGNFTSPIGHQVGAIPTWGTDSSILPGIDATALKAGQAVSSAQMSALGSGDIPGMFTGEGTAFGSTGLGTKGFVPLGGTAPTVPSVTPNLSNVPFDTGSVSGDFSGPFGPDPSATNLFEHSVPQSGLSAGDDYAKDTNLLKDLFGEKVDKHVTKAGDLLFGKAPDTETLNKAAAKLVAENPTLYGPGTDKGAARALEFVTKDLSPGPVRQMLPTAALLGGAAYLGGAFDPPEQEEGESEADFRRRFEEFNNRQGTSHDFRDFMIKLRPDDRTPEGPAFTPTPVGFYGETAFAANGGPAFLETGGADEGFRPEMYRQRARALVQGPGTEKSDSIPARLSNGEFVLTARAVRGADPTGQGDRYRGAQNLYKLMRNFEMRA